MNSGDGGNDRRDLRRALRHRRRDTTPAERIAAGEAVAAAILAHPRFPAGGYIAGYWASNGEVPLHLLQLRLAAEHVWCLPCIQPGGALAFAPWQAGDPLVANRFGIPEPELLMESLLPAADMALIVVPLLGYTRDGHRLGTGGGFYDRTLAFRQDAPAPPWLVGAGYHFQQLESLPARPWDVRLDAIATEQGLFET